MAFYKKRYSKSYKVYYPFAVVVGKPVETKDIVKDLATISTVSRADINAVLGDLAQVLHGYMKNGKSVHLEGLGYFRYTLSATGVASVDDFDFDEQLKSVKVQFSPERTKSASGGYTSELVDYSSIEWIELSSDADEEATGSEE